MHAATKLHGCVDSDWGSKRQHRRSISVITFVLAGAATFCKTRCQTTAAPHSTEAEHAAAADQAKLLFASAPFSKNLECSCCHKRKRTRRSLSCTNGRDSGASSGEGEETNQSIQVSHNHKKEEASNGGRNCFLDLGQANFGKQSVCPICGMLTVHGVEEDRMQHEQICDVHKNGVELQIRRNGGAGARAITSVLTICVN
jgi:hypothetical protein